MILGLFHIIRLYSIIYIYLYIYNNNNNESRHICVHIFINIYMNVSNVRKSYNLKVLPKYSN